jgi:hypothetical protein
MRVSQKGVIPAGSQQELPTVDSPVVYRVRPHRISEFGSAWPESILIVINSLGESVGPFGKLNHQPQITHG